MDIYMANCTKQRQEVWFWAPETAERSPRLQPIEIGQQVKLSGDYNTLQAQAIVEQLSKYGLVHVRDINRYKPFVGLCWDEKPIHVSRIQEGMAHNQIVLEERGLETRKLAAVAVNDALSNASEGKLPISATQVEIQELDRKDGKEGTFAENIRVSSETPEQAQENYAKQRRSRPTRKRG